MRSRSLPGSPIVLCSGYAISGTDLASDAYGPTCICYPTSGTDLASRAARFDPETEQLVTYDKHNVTYLPTRPLSCNGHVWYSNIPRGPGLCDAAERGGR